MVIARRRSALRTKVAGRKDRPGTDDGYAHGAVFVRALCPSHIVFDPQRKTHVCIISTWLYHFNTEAGLKRVALGFL